MPCPGPAHRTLGPGVKAPAGGQFCLGARDTFCGAGDRTELIMGCLREEVKVWKGMDWGDSGWNKHGNRRERLWEPRGAGGPGAHPGAGLGTGGCSPGGAEKATPTPTRGVPGSPPRGSPLPPPGGAAPQRCARPPPRPPGGCGRGHRAPAPGIGRGRARSRAQDPSREPQEAEQSVAGGGRRRIPRRAAGERAGLPWAPPAPAGVSARPCPWDGGGRVTGRGRRKDAAQSSISRPGPPPRRCSGPLPELCTPAPEPRRVGVERAGAWGGRGEAPREGREEAAGQNR